MNAAELGYALSRPMPAMRDAVELHTIYGALVLYADEASAVATVVERLLRARLWVIEAARD
jgi:hypothetical protein